MQKRSASSRRCVKSRRGRRRRNAPAYFKKILRHQGAAVAPPEPTQTEMLKKTVPYTWQSIPCRKRDETSWSCPISFSTQKLNMKTPYVFLKVVSQPWVMLSRNRRSRTWLSTGSPMHWKGTDKQERQKLLWTDWLQSRKTKTLNFWGWKAKATSKILTYSLYTINSATTTKKNKN